MSWFKRQEAEAEGAMEGSFASSVEASGEKRVKTEGLWIKCDRCRQVIFKADLEANSMVCPKCDQHFRIGARQRIEILLEPGYELVDLELRSTDPLKFVDT